MFFFNDSATTEIYPYWHSLSLHDALPISSIRCSSVQLSDVSITGQARDRTRRASPFNSRMLSRMGETDRSEEHTSELQSLMRISYAVFCLKKKKQQHSYDYTYQIIEEQMEIA